MRIQVASDLHYEFYRGAPITITPAPGADALILAGDIANGANALSAFRDWPVPVVYVAGNHEFYEHSLPDLQAEARPENESPVRWLENAEFIHEGVRFLGATLWTDYELDGCRDDAMALAVQALSDHRLIRKRDGGAFTPADAVALHRASRRWLAHKLREPFAGKTVVVTHHAPHPSSIDPAYEGHASNPAFVSDLGELMGKPALWIHGHIHTSKDYVVDGTRVVCNPRGYPLRKSRLEPAIVGFENRTFSEHLMVEV